MTRLLRGFLAPLTSLLVCLCLISPAGSGSMGLLGVGGPSAAPPPSFSLTYESSNNVNDTTNTTVDYGTLSYGSGNIRVVALIVYRTTTSGVVGVTIGGTSLTQISSAAGGVFPDYVDAWISTAPLAGSSGDVQVTYTGPLAGASPGSGVALYNLVTGTPAPSATNTGSTGFGPSTSTTLTVPSGGAATVVGNSEGTSIASGTNFTIDAHVGQGVVGHTTSTGSVTPTINSSASDAMVISATAWAP